MRTFREIFDSYRWDDVQNAIMRRTPADVQKALQSPRPGLNDFMSMISPAAESHLDDLAVRAGKLTRQRFGKTVQMFAPMYLSNECNNICTYCGYSFGNKIRRRTLTDEEIIREGEAIRDLGFSHVLLVSGEANATVHTAYFLNAIRLLRPLFSSISVEVQPLEENEYRLLHEAGVHAVLVYQETYSRESYRVFHPKGKKANFDYRLDTPERLGRSGIHKIGLGVLLGLEDWRTDAFFAALHLSWLQKTFWRTRFSMSFPRIRPAEGVTIGTTGMPEEALKQLMLAFRLFNPDLEISISTRESREFRDSAANWGATSMSAGSRTNPGGYVVDPQSLEQFEVEDHRTPGEFAEVLSAHGYEPVWKDWDHAFAR